MLVEKPHYGIDAPPVVAGFLVVGVLPIVCAWAIIRFFWPSWFWLAPAIASLLIFFGAYCIWITLSMVRSSLVRKIGMRDRLLDQFLWKGNERVLDVGCGRGLLVIGAAKRLLTGKAVGIDIWRRVDQSGNSMEAAQTNVRIEGVSDRVELQTADVRQMPFQDHIFDVVVSSLAIHNISESAERAKALAEIARVMKPGGRIAIWDIQSTAEYQDFFTQAGFQEIKREGPLGIWYDDYLLTARKP